MAIKKYFGTDGVRGKVGESPIIPAFIVKLGWAVGKVLSNHGSKLILIGKDTRISGYMLESALEAGIASTGQNTAFTGPMPTPAIAYLTKTLHAEAGIVISASHNPYYDNGIKIFSKDGSKLPDSIEEEIEQMLQQEMDCVPSDQLGKAVRIKDAPGRYIEFCKSAFPRELSLDGIKIVLDCANGATYHIAGNVMRELGADVVEINIKPDGININDQCGATNVESLRTHVIQEKADVGFAYDGDGDRLIAVDACGNIVDGDNLLFIIAKDLHDQKKLVGGVVGTEMSNIGLEKSLNSIGIPFTRSKVGDRYVLEELKHRGWLIGGESSGHIIQLDKNSTGDGIIASLAILAIMVKRKISLELLAEEMVKYPQYLINLKCNNAQEVVQGCLAEAQHIADQKLNKQGRMLLRASGTEPLIRIMVESIDEELAKRVLDEMKDFIKKRL